MLGEDVDRFGRALWGSPLTLGNQMVADVDRRLDGNLEVPECAVLEPPVCQDSFLLPLRISLSLAIQVSIAAIRS